MCFEMIVMCVDAPYDLYDYILLYIALVERSPQLRAIFAIVH